MVRVQIQHQAYCPNKDKKKKRIARWEMRAMMMWVLAFWFPDWMATRALGGYRVATELLLGGYPVATGWLIGGEKVGD